MLQMKNSDVWTADCRTIRNHTKTSEGMSGLNIAGIYLLDKRRGMSRQFERELYVREGFCMLFSTVHSCCRALSIIKGRGRVEQRGICYRYSFLFLAAVGWTSAL